MKRRDPDTRSVQSVAHVTTGEASDPCHALEEHSVTEELLKVASSRAEPSWGSGAVHVVVDATGRALRPLCEGAPEPVVALQSHDAGRGRLAFAWQPSERAPRAVFA